jgi:hypothetical protein
MNLPANFQFTQGNLQDFMDCRRRFYLGSIRQLAWPAVEAEPFIENEQFMQQGAAFHRLIQQYYLGIDPNSLENLASSPPIGAWWHNFIHHTQLPNLASAGAQLLPEFSLTAISASYRITAKFDLIATLPDNKILIYDWKTSRRRPHRKWLADRMQTRLYRYLLLRAGKHLVNFHLDPELISMVYWFAGFPDQPEFFPYSVSQAQQDERDFSELIGLITHLVAQDNPNDPGISFPQTSDEKRCAFCKYRSLCDRGVRAGELSAIQDDSILDADDSFDDFELNFEHIAEIEF